MWNKIGTILFVIICALILLFSYGKWKDKVNSVKSAEHLIEQSAADATDSADATTSTNEPKIDRIEPPNPTRDHDHLLSLLANQDEAVQQVFQNRLAADETINFLLLGSSAMNNGEPGYAALLTDALNDAYGDLIQVTTTMIQGTTTQFITNGMQNEVDLTAGYDVVLFEPLTLNNNGFVARKDEQQHIATFRAQVLEQVPDAVLVLHPPQPLYASIHYPAQVSSLQAFAATENIAYVNHWENWPAINAVELKQYLNEDSTPNSDGAALWANALIHYFIAK